MKLSKELLSFLQSCDESFESNQFSFNLQQPVSGFGRAMKILGRESLVNELKKHHRNNDVKIVVDDEWVHIKLNK